jgi:general stress protein 26
MAWHTAARPRDQATDGRPHAMPVWGLWVEGVFYFSTGPKSRKARNLARNPRCIVCSERADEAVIKEGVARVIKDGQLLERLAGPYHAKYKPWTLDPELGPVYAVRPRKPVEATT